MLNINDIEYKKRVSEIRRMIYGLADDMGAVYSTMEIISNKIVKDAIYRDLTEDEPF